MALAGFAAAVLFSAGCFPRHQAVRQESFAAIDTGQRGAVFDRALQVLLDRGWVMAAVNREAGVLATQPRETYLQDWVGYQRDTLQASFRADGRLAVSLHRQFLPATTATTAHAPGPGAHGPVTYAPVSFGPDPARLAATAAAEQDAILFEITSAVPVAALGRCRKLASEYASALAHARACGQLGARVCSEVRPAIEEGSQVLGSGSVSVVPSRAADLDRVLAEYRQTGCAFSDRAAPGAVPGDECLGHAGAAICP
jgi:hypothetical protein